MKETHSIQGFARLVAALRQAEREADHARAAVLRERVDAAVREILAPTLFSAEDDT